MGSLAPCTPAADRGPPVCDRQRRFFGVGGSYGYGAFFRGEADVAAESNVRRQRLQREEGGEGGPHRGGPMELKMPETVATLVAEGALRKQVPVNTQSPLLASSPMPHICCCLLCGLQKLVEASSLFLLPSACRPLERSGVAVYHHHVPQDPQRSLVFLSAPTHQAGAPAAAVTWSLLQQRERGVAAQLILDGRGVKAYFEGEWPNLMVRLGVGVKPLAFRRLAEQYATKARIFVDKRGRPRHSLHMLPAK
ncbi:hypothetical protein Efla_006166 [Eimeria flavescens]